MCLAIPVKIERIEDDSTAIADISGLRKAINISLVADVKAGDYVILHVGFALKKLDEEEAQKTLAMISDIDLHNARTEAAAGI